MYKLALATPSKERHRLAYELLNKAPDRDEQASIET